MNTLGQKTPNKIIVGVIGGMGPLATVEFQRLLIEATPATCDQEHLEVLAHNNSRIPDRTQSLADDDGASYVAAVIESGRKLINAGATVLVMPCVTAHARFELIQAALNAPILHIVEAAAQEVVAHYSSKTICVGILATNGTIQDGLIERSFAKFGLRTIKPDQLDQQKVMKTAYELKAGKPRKSGDILEVARCLKARGAQMLVIGCTELAVYEAVLNQILPTINPMKVAARVLVQRQKSATT